MSIRQIFNERVDLVKLINLYGVDLDPFGDVYIGQCPFPGCQKRCFVIRRLVGEYECLSCGVTGDAIDFMVKADGFVRDQAVELLMRLFDIQPDELMFPRPMSIFQPREFVVNGEMLLRAGRDT